MSVSGALFDMEKLLNISKNYLSTLSALEVYQNTLEWAKVYDEDFKKMIVELYENKKPICELKREYGLADATIYRWINEYGKIKTETGEITNNHEIKRLKKENLKLKEELEILKKAIAIFTPK